jgi:cell division transport system permease protein
MSWLRYHWLALGDGFNHFRRAPGNFLLNVLVVAIALALPFAGLTLLENVHPVSERLAVQPEISVFMQIGATRDQSLATGAAIRKNLQQSGTDANIEYIPREKALDSLKNKTGLNDALTTLGSNPLPDAYVVRLSGFDIDATQVDGIADKLKTLPQVESVQIDSAWVKRLAALLHVLRLALLFLAVTLGVVVVAVVFNTIRMQVMTQYDEIEVSRLLGATDGFIHRPFYYTGALLGVCAGAVALAAVAAGLQPMNGAVSEFARLYGSEFVLKTLDLSATLGLLGLSAVLGLLGAMLSVRRHLGRLN